jgi:hypothetical protein
MRESKNPAFFDIVQAHGKSADTVGTEYSQVKDNAKISSRDGLHIFKTLGDVFNEYGPEHFSGLSSNLSGC